MELILSLYLKVCSPKINNINPIQRPDFLLLNLSVSPSEFLDNVDLIELYENF